MLRLSTFAAAMVTMTNAKSTGLGLEVQDDYNFDVRYDTATDEAIFDVVIPDGTWFALMLGSDRMTRGSDIIIFEANGSSSDFHDATSNGYSSPKIDAADNLTGSFEQVGGEVKFTVRRPIDTDDFDNDYVIPLDTSFKCSYAINSRTNSIGSKHQSRYRKTLTLKSDGQPTFGPKTDDGSGAKDETETDKA